MTPLEKEIAECGAPPDLADGLLEKTLEVLENHVWGEPNYNSNLVLTCHAMRKIPLKDLTVGHLRMVIGQQFSLPYLMPLAVRRLRDDPFVEGDFYPGDLLRNVLRVEDAYFEWDPKTTASLVQICQEAEADFNANASSDDIKYIMIDDLLWDAIDAFLGKYG